MTGIDGVARRVDVVRAVNVATDPALKNGALEGTLHRLEGGTYLAVPYVYHDPAARKFALVIPVARSHEELHLRAGLLEALAADTSAPLPTYVRDARVVIGIDGLQRYLAEAHDARAAVAAEMESKFESVAQREERLRDRAEDVTRREDELRLRTEDVDVARTDIAVREQELEQRLADVLAREEALSDEERALLANKSALQGRERLLESREELLAARERELSTREAEFVSHAASVADANAREPQHRPSQPEAIEPIDSDAEGDAEDEAEPIEAEAEQDEEGEEPVEEATPLPGPLPAASEAALEADEAEEAEEVEEAQEAEEAEEEIEPEPTTSVPAAWLARGQDTYVAVIDGEVRLWTRGGAELASRLAQGNTPPVLQVDPESKLPQALLSVVAPDSGQRLARVVLDVTRPDDRAVIETLGRDFRVRVEVVSQGGRAVGSYAVADQCEANALQVLEVLSKREPGTDDARRIAGEQLAREGVVSVEGEAFERALADESTLGMVEGVERAVAAYAPLMEPAALERFVLSRGVPAGRIEGFGKKIFLAALRCGVELPPALVARALESGLGADERLLATRALTAFARTSDGGLETIGRTRSDASRAWAPLLAWATRVGADVPDAARAAMRALFDPDDPDGVSPPDPRPTPTADAIKAMSDEELGRWADHPDAREAVAVEMIARDPSRFAEPLSRALRVCAPERAAELAAAMTAAGDALGDVWVELLGSRRVHAPVLAAVATASIKLRRGLNPLLQRALARDEREWKVFAWAAGDFGTAAVRALSRMNEASDPERLGWVLAHAVRAGAGRDVEKSRSSSNRMIAEAATRGVGRVDEARAFDAALRHGTSSTEGERWASTMLSKIDRPAAKGDDDAAAREGA
ncbi:MAG: hypothetical protein ACXWP4_20570 [Polyangiales bacterium]